MGFSRAPRTKNVLFCNVICIGLVAIVFLLIFLRPWTIRHEEEKFVIRSLDDSPEVKILSSALSAEKRNRDCNYFNCFDVYKCDYSLHKLKIYIYPIYKYVFYFVRTLLKESSDFASNIVLSFNQNTIILHYIARNYVSASQIYRMYFF